MKTMNSINSILQKTAIVIAMLVFSVVLFAVFSEAQEKTPPAPPIQLFPGKTLISAPFSTVTKINADGCGKIKRVLNYVQDDEAYADISDIKKIQAGIGYQVIMDSEKECAIYFEGSGKVGLDTVMKASGGKLSQGKNLLSGTSTTIDLSLPQNAGDCKITKVLSYSFQDEAYIKLSALKIERGKAYLAYVENSNGCTLGTG